ncbi:MAG: hypothetical protein HY840_07130 [Bacteroidetes bacterium]|nr:hypothetical protein [Bacteroidota bacterium]
MKKTIITSAIALIITGAAFAQPVSDRAVIPIGVTLQQILRIHVTNGGNVEFVFNDINDYKNGIVNSAFYDSDVQVASSTDWELHMGAEDATLIGTEDPANTLALNNIGFTITWTGGNSCCAAGNQLSSILGVYDNSATGTANGLLIFTGGAGDLLLVDGGNVAGSGGDVTDNAFTINWECGTLIAGTTPMNATSIIAQSPTPDRYVTNVFLDLEAL